MFANVHPHPGYHVTDFDEAYKMRGIAWSSPFSALIKAMFPSSRTIGPQELNANDHGKPDIMAPIDYSKWNNIDTDSEGESFPAKPPAPKAETTPTVPPAPTSTTPASSTTPAPATAPDTVQAVIVRSGGERLKFMPWSATTLPTNDGIFSQPVPPSPDSSGSRWCSSAS